MNFRNTAILFGVVVVVLVALILIFAGGDKGSPDSLVPAFTSAGYKPEDVEVLELVRTEPNEQKLVFTRKDKQWSLTEPFKAKIEQDKIQRIVDALFKAKIVAYSGLTSNPAVHGLSPATVRITLKGKNNTTATVNIGLTTPGGSSAHTFVTTDKKPDKPLAVRANDLTDLFKSEPGSAGHDGPAAKHALWLSDVRRSRLIASDLRVLDAETQTITLKQGAKQLVLSASKDSTWTITSPALGLADLLGDSATRPGEITGVKSLLDNVALLQPASTEGYIENVPPADWPKYGLAETDPNVLAITLLPKFGAPETLYIGKQVEEKGKLQPSTYYCRMDGDAAVVKTLIAKLEPIRKLLDDASVLRDRGLVADSIKFKIDAIDVQLGDKLTKLRKLKSDKGPRWVIYSSSGAYEARTNLVDQLLNGLVNRRAVGDVLAGTVDDAFKQPLGEVRLWADGVGAVSIPMDGKIPAEPKLNGNPVAFLLGSQDTVKVGMNTEIITHVRRTGDGAVTVMRIPQALLTTLNVLPTDYIDPKLPSFAISIVKKLSFNRGTESYELVRAPDTDTRFPKGSWLFAKPESRKDTLANKDNVEALLTMISGTSPRIVQEGGAPKPEWNVAANGGKTLVKVELDTPTDNTRTFSFGNDLENKLETYLMVGSSPFVFATGKGLSEQFEKLELRDRTVFRMNFSEVSKVILSGWQKNKDTPPQTLTLEREKTGWKATTPEGFAIDVARLNGLLTNLEAARVMDFVTPTPESAVHGLEPQLGSLDIIFTLPSGGGHSLRLGKVESTSIYALASTDRQQIIKLDGLRFAQYLAGPEVFGKPAEPKK